MAATINFANLSTVNVDDDALTAAAGETLINFGSLTTTGDLADGIFAGADDVTIRHFGSIETSGLGAAGIVVLGENARIENFGSVHTTGAFFGDFEAFSEGIFVLGDGFYVANHGSVRVEGESSSALVGLGEDGVVINFKVVESDATNSAVMGVDGARSKLINVGQVTVTGDDNTVMFVGGEDASGLNLGQIVVTGTANVMQGVGGSTDITNKGSIRVTAENSIGMGGFFGNGHEVSNFGLIEMEGNFSFGMAADGLGPPFLPPEAGSDHEIVNTGRITTDGDVAVGIALGMRSRGFTPAETGQIENRGVVETEGDGAAGVVMVGDGHHLINSGRITTDGGAFDSEAHGVLHAAGVLVSGDEALVENARTGKIESQNADSAAVELNVLERDGLSNAATSSTLENFGLIEGDVAILGGVGEETVINHGRIVGDVDLGGGADTFIAGKGGSVAGDVSLGGGDDVVVVQNGSGTTEIADFAAGVLNGDVINVSAFFSDFDDLLDQSSQQGADVVIALDHNDTLVLSNLQLSVLTAGDFLLV